jgi:hypothetical protein
MLFRGISELFFSLPELRAPPVQLIGVEAEHDAAASTDRLHLRSLSLSTWSTCSLSSTRVGYASVTHVDRPHRWFAMLVRPYPPKRQMHRCLSYTGLHQTNNCDFDVTGMPTALSTDSLPTSLQLFSAEISLNCYDDDDEIDLASRDETALSHPHAIDLRSDPERLRHRPYNVAALRPYIIRRTIFHFRLLIIGLYREFLDKPQIILPLHKTAEALFSADIETERQCIGALLDTMFSPSETRSALLDSRAMIEFFSRWPGDRTRDELAKASLEFSHMFDSWDGQTGLKKMSSKEACKPERTLKPKSSMGSLLPRKLKRQLSKRFRGSESQPSAPAPAPKSLADTLTFSPSTTTSEDSSASSARNSKFMRKSSVTSLADKGMRVVRKALRRASLAFNSDDQPHPLSPTLVVTSGHSNTGSISSWEMEFADANGPTRASMSSWSSSVVHSANSSYSDLAMSDTDSLFGEELISALDRICPTTKTRSSTDEHHTTSNAHSKTNMHQGHSTQRKGFGKSLSVPIKATPN